MSQFSGRLCSFKRVPLHVLRTRRSGRDLLWYFFQFVRMRSRSNLSFRMVFIWFLSSCGLGGLLGIPLFVSKSLRQRVFQRRNAHSDAAIRRRRVAPFLVVPFGDLILRTGRAMIVVMSKPCGQAICFILHSSLTTFHALSHLFASQLKIMCCMDSIVLQLWHIPRAS